MLDILIIEDNSVESAYCKSNILDILPDANIIQSKTAENAIHILDTSHIDATFIDIELPGINGFEFAEAIRNDERYHLLPIVFVTGIESDWLKIMKKFRNYEYIIKPYLRDEFKDKLEKFLKGLTLQTQLYVKHTPNNIIKKIIKVNGKKELINVNDILFAEVFKKRTTIFTKDDKFERIDMGLKKLIHYLNDSLFIQCHKSYAVNIRQIRRIQECSVKAWDIQFHDGKFTCPLSANYKEKVQSLFESRVY